MLEFQLEESAVCTLTEGEAPTNYGRAKMVSECFQLPHSFPI